MKRKLLLVVFSVFTAMIAVCQAYVQFPSSHATWSYLTVTGFQGANVDTNIVRITIDGEQTWNNKQYHKLKAERGSFATPTVEDAGYFREENQKIYFIEHDYEEELLLYDFTKQVGDTVKYVNGYGDILNTSVVKVIDSIFVDGVFRKRFKVELENNQTQLFRRVDYLNQQNTNPMIDYWVEGIGSIQFGFSSHIEYMTTCACYHVNNFICLTQNDTVKLLSPKFDDCIPSFLRSSINVPSITSTKVYQQVGSLVVESSEIPDKIEVCDLLGKNVYSILPIEPKSIVSLTSCRKGVYIVKSTFGKSIVTNKIVIR
ncbi:MAG: T9SS type A sorting domain-containing protein [Bacteroidales bacterium]|nr:T9SS type A sorting domain-containing protein [Bacteroidales bacterium]